MKSVVIFIIATLGLSSLVTADIIPPTGPVTPRTAGVLKKSTVVSSAIDRLRAGKHDEALSLLESATRADPTLPPAKLMLARLLIASGEERKARSALEEAVVEAPNHPGPRALLGDLALSDGRIADAELAFEKTRVLAEALKPDDPILRDSLASASAGLAGVAERRGQWAKALTILESWAERDPNDSKPPLRIGRVLFHLGRIEDARAQLERATTLDATLDPPGITLGILHSESGHFDLALRELKRAVEAAPKDPRPRLGLARWLLDRERASEARDAARYAAELEPSSSRAKLLIGIASLQMGEFEDAESNLETAYRAAPSNAEVVDKLVLVLAARSDTAKKARAIELAEANLRRTGGDARSLATLGRVLAMSGRSEAALKALRAASPGDRATPEIALGLALALEAEGRRDEAERLLRSALSAPVGQFPSRLEAKQALDRIVSAAKLSR